MDDEKLIVSFKLRRKHHLLVKRSLHAQGLCLILETSLEVGFSLSHGYFKCTEIIFHEVDHSWWHDLIDCLREELDIPRSVSLHPFNQSLISRHTIKIRRVNLTQRTHRHLQDKC